MKRSEAVELIFRRLGPVGISEPTCEEVLAILEDAGIIRTSSSLSEEELNHEVAKMIGPWIAKHLPESKEDESA